MQPRHGRAKFVARALVGLAVLVASGMASGTGPPWRVVANLPLGGHSPRFDYQALDSRAQRLYIAHQGDGAIVVVDLRKRSVIDTIRGLPNVHGLLLVARLHRLFATATGSHQLVVIDTRTRRVLSRHRAGIVPDGMAYDPRGHALYISDERPAGALVIADARTGRSITTIPLAGSAGNVQYDPTRQRILVGVETRDQLAIIDPTQHSITIRVPLPGCDANHSLLMDDAARLLLVGCSGNGRLLILDADIYTPVGHIDGAGHIDVLALDPATQQAFVTAEDGRVTLLQLRGHARPRIVGRERLLRAHTIAIDPRTHLAYLPLGRATGKSTLRILQPTHPPGPAFQTGNSLFTVP
ncbi:MAG: YncE family protein [Actinomycetota bacterium]|nr:YncE family protein [Actinomycetota bacterium]